MTGRFRWVLIFLALTAAPAVAMAQFVFSGELGMDYGVYSFQNTIAARGLDYGVNRRISSHSLLFRASGPLVNNHFANFNGSVRLKGIYHDLDLDYGQVSEYMSPYFSDYTARFSLFPDRSYPLTLFTGKSSINMIRYEAANRSSFDLVNPGLGVVRRYQSESTKDGIKFDFAPSQSFSLSVEFEDATNEITRRYDQDENLNIWLDAFTIFVDPVSATHYVELQNLIDDDPVVLYVDNYLHGTLEPGMTMTLQLEKGEHTVDVLPTLYRPLHMNIDVQGDMTWDILYSEPEGAKDSDQVSQTFLGSIHYTRDEQLTNSTMLELTDRDDSTLGIESGLTNLNNSMLWRMSDTHMLNTSTIYNKNVMDIDDVGKNESSIFSHTTDYRWGDGPAARAGASHSYSHTDTDDKGALISSDMHMINTSGMKETGFYGHVIDVQAAMTKINDTKGQDNSQLMGDLKNTMKFHGMGVNWAPRVQLTQSKSVMKTPGDETRVSSKEGILGLDVKEIPVRGNLDLEVKGEYRKRSRSSQNANEGLSKRRIMATLMRKFGRSGRLTATVMSEDEFRTSLDDPNDPNVHISGASKGDQSAKSLRFSGMFMKPSGITASGTIQWYAQNDISTSRMNGAISLPLPLLKVPLKLTMIRERRRLVGRPEQTRFEFESTLGYNFRKIRTVLSYSRLQEKLIVEDYAYGELSVTATRSF